MRTVYEGGASTLAQRPFGVRAGPAAIYARGYGGCASTHLSTEDGTLVSRVTHASEPPLSLTRVLPGDTFGVAVALDAHRAEVRHGDRVIRSGVISAGHVNFQRPGQTTHTTTVGRWDVLFFYLPRTKILRLCEAADTRVDLDRLTLVDPRAGMERQMLAFARRVRDEIGTPDAFSRLRVDLIVQDLIVHVLRRHSGLAPAAQGRGPDRGGLTPVQLRRAFDAMLDMPERDITLATLAAAVGCSPSHFSRAFKQSTGIAPFAWLLDRRIERAKALLRMGDLPIAEVALAVGFAGQASFTTAFKRATGDAPAAWRRRSG